MLQPRRPVPGAIIEHSRPPWRCRHLVFPLLEFLSQRQTYDVAEIEQAKLDLIEKTNMVDYAVDIYQTLNETDEASPLAAQQSGQAWLGLLATEQWAV